MKTIVKKKALEVLMAKLFFPAENSTKCAYMYMFSIFQISSNALVSRMQAIADKISQGREKRYRSF